MGQCEGGERKMTCRRARSPPAGKSSIQPESYKRKRGALPHTRKHAPSTRYIGT